MQTQAMPGAHNDWTPGTPPPVYRPGGQDLTRFSTGVSQLQRKAGLPAASLKPLAPRKPVAIAGAAPIQRAQRERRDSSVYQVSYKGMSTSSGGYKPAKDSNTVYPDYPMDVLTTTYQDKDLTKMAELTSRSSFQSTQTPGMIDFVSSRSDTYHTKEDEVMISEPKAKLTEKGISRNHKLADSSIRAIMVGLWWRLKNKPFKQTEEKIVLNFFKAMLEDPKDAKVVLGWLQEAVDESTVYKAVGPLSKGIKELSISYKNLRFGDAELNERILFAFDPNVYSDGSATPLGETILSAGKKLARILPPKVVDNAFTQAVDKTTGEDLTSTMVT